MRTIYVEDKKETATLSFHPKAVKGDLGSVGAPMPGQVVSIYVKESDKVEKGDPLVVLTAMKMELVVSAPKSGVVKQIHIGSGQKLSAGDLLIDIE
ncbi:PC [Bugula neritina]|uniref:PC n=1 Tax=Bugula neritina TaxID=10212 RepID=A0A7J7J8Y2_BUGNE|nr:PC [Bugula neritina]